MPHGLFDQGIKKEGFFGDFDAVGFNVKGLNHRPFPRRMRDIKVKQFHLTLNNPV